MMFIMGKVPVFGTSTHTLDISQLGYVFVVVLCSRTVKLNTPGQNTGVGSRSLLQGIFPTQGSNPGLPHCRQILYQLRFQGSPNLILQHANALVCKSFNKETIVLFKIFICLTTSNHFFIC